MKTPKLLVIIFISFFAVLPFSFADAKTKSLEQSAEQMLSILERDIVLTHSQKVLIKEHAKTFITKTRLTKDMQSNDETRRIRKDYVIEYETALDSILTEEQTAELTLKREKRREAIIGKNNTNQ